MVKRYDIEECASPWEYASYRDLVESPSGEWVRSEDYDKLLTALREIVVLDDYADGKARCIEIARKALEE